MSFFLSAHNRLLPNDQDGPLGDVPWGKRAFGSRLYFILPGSIRRLDQREGTAFSVTKRVPLLLCRF
jgi:hypothetical protein